MGAFLGDFVKGSHLNQFTDAERLGILLHRKIDSFTDQHSELSRIKELFSAGIRRYSGIALDIYFDHILISKWSQFSSRGADDLLSDFYQELAQTDYAKSARYTRVKSTLIQERWLSRYQDEQICLEAMRSIESRFRHSAVFAEEAFSVLKQNRRLLEHCFESFYPELMQMSENMSEQIRKKLLAEKQSTAQSN